MNNIQKKSRKEKQQINKKVQPKPVISKKLVIILGIIIALAGFLLYSNTLNHGFALDDYSVMKDNYIVKRGTDGLGTILTTNYRYGYWNSQGVMYRPMSLIMFALEWDIFGYDENTGTPDGGPPFGSHLINVLLYAFTGMILFFTLRKILHKYNLIIPFVCTLLFIVHPIHTEIVANIKSRDEILSFFFVVLSIQWLWKYFDKNKIISLIVSVLFFFLSFMSRESTISYLAVIPLFIIFFTENEGLKRKLAISLIYIVPTAAYLLLRMGILGQLNVEAISMNDNPLVGAKNDPSIFLHQLPTAILLLGKYLLKMIWPHPLTSDYSYNEVPLSTFGNIKVILVFVLYLAIGIFSILGLLWSFKRRKNHEFKRNADLLSFGILFFFATIALAANIFFLIGVAFAERMLYAPLLGFTLIISVALAKIFKVDFHELVTEKSLGAFAKKFAAILAVAAVLVIACGYKTIDRNKAWKNNYDLYSTDVVVSNESSRIHYHYGLAVVQDRALKTNDQNEKNKYLDIAIEEFNTAISIYPHNADIYDQLALAYLRKGNNDEALKYFEMTVERDSLKARPYSNMGMIYFTRATYEKSIGNNQNAIELYQKTLGLYLKAVKLDPRFADAWYNLGSTYGTLGQVDNAIKSYMTCLEFEPAKFEAHYFMGITYAAKGDLQNAIKCYKNVIAINPKHDMAHLNLAKIYQSSGDVITAEQYFKKAFELNPKLKN